LNNLQQMSRKFSHKVVALTGSIGSGKSAALEIFEKLGARIFDADLLAREVVMPGSIGLAAIATKFGQEVISPDGSLDRKKMAKIVFADSARRLDLEDILHPLIRERFLERLEDATREEPDRLVVYGVPLYFESRFQYPEISEVIFISAPTELRRARVMNRDKMSESEFNSRMAAQLSDEEKEKRSDIVIPNSGTLAELEGHVRDVYGRLS
jgi:dephospho-CoA kinase